MTEDTREEVASAEFNTSIASLFKLLYGDDSETMKKWHQKRGDKGFALTYLDTQLTFLQNSS